MVFIYLRNCSLRLLPKYGLLSKNVCITSAAKNYTSSLHPIREPSSTVINKPWKPISQMQIIQYSDQTGKSEEKPVNLTTRQKLKQAVAQYGSTVIVFHITISLMSLGACYVLISNGVDMSSLLEYTKYIGLSAETVNNKLATNTGTFAAAYLVHKVFAPVRLSITLAIAPFLVRYMRRMGWIKKAVKSNVDKHEPK